MAAITFDTHKFIKTLASAGLPEAQAEAISVAVRDSHESVDVATKRDLDDLRKDIDVKFEKMDVKLEKLDAKFDAKFEKMELRLSLKLGTIIVVSLGAVTVLSKWIS